MAVPFTAASPPGMLARMWREVYSEQTAVQPRLVAPAGIWRRGFAAVLDAGLAIPGAYVASVAADLLYANVFGGVYALTSARTYWGEIAAALFVWLYSTLSESGPRQATPGKVFTNLRVTDEDSRRLTWPRAAARALAKAAVLYVFGVSLIVGPLLVMALVAPLIFSGKKQGLHDLAAQTLVWRASFR